MLGFSPLFASCALVVVSLLAIWLRRCGSRPKDMPPGPPTLPILGNALQFPTTFSFVRFTEWAREYGEIYSLKLLHLNIVVLSSPEAIRSILDAEGAHSGNRLHSRILARGFGDDYIVFQDMDRDIWRKGRKVLNPILAAGLQDHHLPIHHIESLQLLCDILTTPQDIYYHVRRMPMSVLTTLLYGQRSVGYRGTRVERFYEALECINSIADLGGHPPVDLFPILQYIPARWAKWKGLCDRVSAMRQDLYGSFMSDVERAMASDVPSGSLIEELIRDREALGLSMKEITAIGAVTIEGACEATMATMQTFIHTLVNYPECQQRAREEIDRVVGGDRMPTMDDFDRLPYVQALIKELFRFRPTVPTEVPHVASSDLHYKGYVIPKGSIIFMNIWGLCHSPEYFDDPDQFKPERYLGSTFGTKPHIDSSSFRDNLVFGAGRRICPGEHLANRVIAINAMNLLWAFEFSQTDSGDAGMSIDRYMAPGIVLVPSPFPVSVKARHSRRAEIIRTSLEQLIAT